MNGTGVRTLNLHLPASTLSHCYLLGPLLLIWEKVSQIDTLLLGPGDARDDLNHPGGAQGFPELHTARHQVVAGIELGLVASGKACALTLTLSLQLLFHRGFPKCCSAWHWRLIRVSRQADAAWPDSAEGHGEGGA